MYVSVTAVPVDKVVEMNESDWLAYLEESKEYCERERKMKRFANAGGQSERVLDATIVRARRAAV